MNRFLDPSSARIPRSFADDVSPSAKDTDRDEASIGESDASIFWWVYGTQVFAH